VHLFDWDEINFAEAAREMVLTGEYLRVHIDYQPFWEKPPLFLWMQALSMKVFGINEFAARFPNALCGALTLPLLFIIGRSLHDRLTGLLWTLMYVGSFLPHFYFKSGIIDPWFNLFIMLGIIIPMLPKFKHRLTLSAILSGFFIGLAVLTKGPVAYLLAMMTFGILLILDVYKKRDIQLGSRILWLLQMSFVTALTASLWFGIEILRNGTWFIEEFIQYQIRLFSTGDAGHSGPFYYHALILLIGCFPASFFAIKALFNRKEKPMHDRVMLILFWVTLILFSIVKNNILQTQAISKRLLFALVFGILLWTILLLIVPIIGLNLQSILPSIRDEFAKLNLGAPIIWHGYELGIGLMYMIIAGFGVYFLYTQESFEKGILILGISTIFALMTFLPIIAPKIEGYTQGSPIAFYESMKSRDVLIYPTAYKSYAHLFYSGKLPPSDFPNYNKPTDEDLMNGASKKPVFFMAKVKRAMELRKDPRLEPISELHGFTVFRVIPFTKRTLQ
jgi:4-amino-4-deoxy-L-arabinose transferase-like glycosyltransferase